MLDLFTIFTKGGIVLWCFRGTNDIFKASVNALIRSVILQERTGSDVFNHNNLTLQYKLDNECDLIYVVAYQKILQLNYIDKFLTDIHLEFRDKYKNDLKLKNNHNYHEQQLLMDFNFKKEYLNILTIAEEWGRLQLKIPKQMRSYNQSQKSKKTVSSMIERKGGDGNNVNDDFLNSNNNSNVNNKKSVKINENNDFIRQEQQQQQQMEQQKIIDDDILLANRKRLAEKMQMKNKKTDSKVKSPKPTPDKERAGKKPRQWDLGGNTRDLAVLDRSKDKPEDIKSDFKTDNHMIGTMHGKIRDLEVESSEDEMVQDSGDDSSDEDEEEYQNSIQKLKQKQQHNQQQAAKKATSGGMFSLFKGLVGVKNLSLSDMEAPLDKMKDHLIAKNVASDIAQKLCDSVAAKLEGRVLGTFDTVAKTIKQTLTESLVQILSPKRRVDILRDCMEAKKQQRPYVMAFCGVNGVGKSTNLAKICFWLIENNFSVLIAACDTFRAGAVEQLRTHTRHLNALHPPEKHACRQMVQLYEKGYGKDAAGIAMEAIRFGKDNGVDIVLIDTAGRMQDNEPLMRSLTKLIKVNEPDLVLFVGEALVGNEAVDQLVKFNQALADYSSNTNPHLIDGIVLTKFDTIDDKVGAAISMTYITGQPIVFVGTGQTYTDLKALNVKAVVHALMK